LTPVALTIAGSDPSGGAGLQADLKVFHELGVYGTSVVTLLTVQNTCGVDSIDPLGADYIERQLRAVVGDIPPHAAKTGALGSTEAVERVAEWAKEGVCPLVVDPVAVATQGGELLSSAGREALVKQLLPVCALVTPNLDEAEALASMRVTSVVEMEEAAARIAALGAAAVLIKGGHLPADVRAIDLLWIDGEVERLESDRFPTRHTHGTGCAFSAAVTAELARGADVKVAVRAAKLFITRAIETAPGLGRGAGPPNYHVGSI